VQVQSVVVSTVNQGKGVKSGLAVVTIVDDLGIPVEDAVVSGAFSGDVNEDANGTTDANGPTSAAWNARHFRFRSQVMYDARQSAGVFVPVRLPWLHRTET
jgi:hypothetical protein